VFVAVALRDAGPRVVSEAHCVLPSAGTDASDARRLRQQAATHFVLEALAAAL
jgi:hypothetical protein